MHVDRELIEAALIGLQHKRADIDARIEELRSELDLAEPAKAKRASTRRPRAVARKSAPARKKRVLSEGGRARIIAALRKRWAEKKAAGSEAAGSGENAETSPAAKPRKKTARKPRRSPAK